MKAQSYVGTRPIHLYMPGDLLLDADTLSSGPEILSWVTSENVPIPNDEVKASILDIVKPKADDYSALKTTLQVLKLRPDEVIDYHKVLGSVINAASGLIWGVGAVFTVMSVFKELFGDSKTETDKRVEHISKRVDQIYDYLLQKEKKGLHLTALDWRTDLDIVNNAVKNALVSRSEMNLDKLQGEIKDRLDKDLLKMLDPGQANISFGRSGYGYQPSASHWIDACASPYMTLTDGTKLNYREPWMELQGTIWDPGHYIDILLRALIDRIQLVTVTEPAFRSTFYDMPILRKILDGLTSFINKWRASLIIADPLIGLNGGGPLQESAHQRAARHRHRRNRPRDRNGLFRSILARLRGEDDMARKCSCTRLARRNQSRRSRRGAPSCYGFAATSGQWRCTCEWNWEICCTEKAIASNFRPPHHRF